MDDAAPAPAAVPTDSPLKALHDAVSAAGGQSQLAAKIGGKVKQGHVWHWLNKAKRAPAERVIDIERASGVPRSRLRPDLYPPVGAAA